MSQKIRSLAALLLAVQFPFAGSCASIVTGSHDSIELTSVPPGAHYETNTGHSGTMPATVTISDKETLQVRCWMDGYQDENVLLPPRMSGWFLGNIILGGLIGIAIDLISGNWRTHDGTLNLTLIAKPAAASPEQ